MARVLQLMASVFLTTFILGGCAFPGDKQRAHLADNRLTVPLAKSGSHTRGQQYSLHRMRNPDDYNPPKSSFAFIPNSGFFDKSDHSVLVDRLPVATGGEVDGAVTFNLPSDLQSPADCFMVVNAGHWATSLSGAKTPDSVYLIGLTPFAARDELKAAKENLRSAELDIATARGTLANTRAYMGGQCVRREPQLPPQPLGSMSPAEAEQKAEAYEIDSMTKRFGCEMAAVLMHKGKLPSAWKQFARGLSCAERNRNSLMISELMPFANILESFFLSCFPGNWRCVLGYGLTLVVRFVSDTGHVTKELSESYLHWENEVEALKQAEIDEYSRCSRMLAITNSADGTIAAIDRSIAAAEQNLERLKAKKNLDGTYEFDADTLTCDRTLSGYYVHGKREYIDAPSIPRWMR